MRHTMLVLGLGLLLATSARAAADHERCLSDSGKAANKCLLQYQGGVERCRDRGDAACEAALRVDHGPLAGLRDAVSTAAVSQCVESDTTPLGYLSLPDIGSKAADACADWSEDQLTLAYGATPVAPAPPLALCQRTVAAALRNASRRAVVAYGPQCYVPAFTGAGCDRSARDARVAALRSQAVRAIATRCGASFDDLHLVAASDAPLEDRVGGLVDTALTRAKHFALRVYPPRDLGPTSQYGPYPIGITTLSLSDSTRMNVAGTGPRPVTVEVYYPSTAEAVAGHPKDVAMVLGTPVLETPAYRDVALAPGDPRPLVLFSHGNNGIRIQSFFFAAHLASHGYIVVSPDHHGNTFVDTLAGIVDPQVATNRPLDMRFLIDTFLGFNNTPGNFFAGSINPDQIGMSGHSFGGYTTLALAGGSFALGTFTEPRIKAIFPQAPAAPFDDSFFASITIPTMIVGGSLDETVSPADDQQRPFDHLPAGAAVAAYADLTDAGHYTFSDFCEVQRDLLSFLGGFNEACQPRHLPWRHAHDIVNYLSLNFFDATLRGDAAALSRLAPATVGQIEELTYQSK